MRVYRVKSEEEVNRTQLTNTLTDRMKESQEDGRTNLYTWDPVMYPIAQKKTSTGTCLRGAKAQIP